MTRRVLLDPGRVASTGKGPPTFYKPTPFSERLLSDARMPDSKNIDDRRGKPLGMTIDEWMKLPTIDAERAGGFKEDNEANKYGANPSRNPDYPKSSDTRDAVDRKLEKILRDNKEGDDVAMGEKYREGEQRLYAHPGKYGHGTGRYEGKTPEMKDRVWVDDADEAARLMAIARAPSFARKRSD